MAYLDSLDIANRALFHLGARRITSPSEISKNNSTMTFLYDKLRRAELRRNVWRFATRRAVLRPMTPTMMNIAVEPWNAAQLYLPGSLVTDANGVIWMSTQAENLGNAPGVSPVWDEYFGPLCADVFSSVSNYTLWSSSTVYNFGDQIQYQGVAYQSLQAANTNNNPSANSSPWWFPITVAGDQGFYAGDLVYLPAALPGQFVVFMCLNNNNTNVPSVPTAWDPTVQYGLDQVVSYNNAQWRSLIPFNQNITPILPPAAWTPTFTYAQTNQVTGSDGMIYQLAATSSQNLNPVGDTTGTWTATGLPAAWSSIPTLYPSDTGWLPLFCGLEPAIFIYPIGVGPATELMTRNAYRLPAGFLREAPQDPKAGSVSFLGAPSGLMYDDWEFEGNFLVSRDAYPLVFRFVADTINVQGFDDMFCEGLAARMAYEGCEDITQSIGKQGAAGQAYQKFMTEARLINGIEEGATEPPVDDWITCRA